MGYRDLETTSLVQSIFLETNRTMNGHSHNLSWLSNYGVSGKRGKQSFLSL